MPHRRRATSWHPPDVVRLSTVALERSLVACLGVTVVDTAYLSWRYLALHADAVASGTGLCSWSERVDCDVVLNTPQARAFFVPNALLGFGFFFGCLCWWLLTQRSTSSPRQRRDGVVLLSVWLGIATAITLWFYWLLIHLEALCPFCPWNHMFTWFAWGISLELVKRAQRNDDRALVDVDLASLQLPIALCVGQLLSWLGLWLAALQQGWLRG
jgi:uncharacterized membrane protein